MKWLIGNTISWLSQSNGRTASTESESEPGLIFSGYAFTDACGAGGSGAATATRSTQGGLLYADIAGYARLAGQTDEAAQQRLADAIKTMIANVADNGGRIVHLAGDAVLAGFGSADSALHCAINVQLAARQWNAALAFEQQVKFRIGVSFGDAIPDGGDSQALASDLAARLGRLASSGGICVSESISNELGAHSSFRFVPMGKQYIGEISEPVQTFWIEIDAQRIADARQSAAVKITALAS